VLLLVLASAWFFIPRRCDGVVRLMCCSAGEGHGKMIITLVRACTMVLLSNAAHDNYFVVREINKLLPLVFH
jgi:hypothetical protein